MGGAHAELEEGSLVKLDFSKLDKVASKKCDVVPVVVQDSETGAVLIAAYVNQIALDETFKQRVCCLWSTSRNELWVKGLTSGDTLDLDEVRINCEQNSLLFLCTPRRKGACHTKDSTGATRVSCYYRRVVQKPDGNLALEHAGPTAKQAETRGVSLVTASLLVAAAATAASLVTAAVLRK
jgi:phosphoribosyl-AMP cyclohydrolase